MTKHDLPLGLQRLKLRVKSVCVAVGVVSGHLLSDPFLFCLQASRRLPELLRRAILAAVYVCGALARRQSLIALGKVIQGKKVAGMHIAQSALENSRTSAAELLRLSEVARVCANFPLAQQLLDAAAKAQEREARRRRRSVLRRQVSALHSAQARIFYAQGHFARAVEELEGSRSRQARRYVSEYQVYQGFRPVLSHQKNYQPREKTVLHLLTNSLPYTSSGYSLRTQALLNAQAEAGWAVHAATRLAYPVVIGRLPGTSTQHIGSVSYHRLMPWALSTDQRRRLQTEANHLLALALRIRPAVIHTTTHFENAVVARSVASALGIPWVYEVRGFLADTWASTQGENAHQTQKYQLFQKQEALNSMAADAVVTLGETMKTELARAGVAPQKIRLVPNSIDLAALAALPSQRQVRERLQLPQDATLIGIVTSLVYYEGVDVLLDSFEDVADKLPGALLVIVGDGAERRALEEQASQLPHADRVIFTGRVSRTDALAYHHALDVFVVPRRRSKVTELVTPLKPVEAAALGKQLVLSDLGALREVRSPTRPLYVSGPTRENLGRALRDAVAIVKAQKESGRAREDRSEIWDQAPSWQRSAQTLAELYDSLVKERD